MEYTILKYALCILSQLFGTYLLMAIIYDAIDDIKKRINDFSDFLELFAYIVGFLLSLAMIVVPIFFYITK